jgi:hypothetical protein
VKERVAFRVLRKYIYLQEEESIQTLGNRLTDKLKQIDTHNVEEIWLNVSNIRSCQKKVLYINLSKREQG